MSHYDSLRSDILDGVRKYATRFAAEAFVPGQSAVPVSGKVFDADEIALLTEASLDFWLTSGRFAAQFEREFSRWHEVRYALLCNSGSSANLLAVSALTSRKLGHRRLRAGDEIITVAAGFPTTVNPIFQNGMIPVFVDISLPTYNIDVTQLELSLSSKTRAIVLAHTLGNPFNISAVREFATKHNLWLIEDNCDGLGSRYKGRLTGTFGDVATVCFYPAHHITMGEGGCILLDNPLIKTLVESYRDWGRDCWCEPGRDDTCGKRFEWQLGELPCGYDHKYTYSHIGYNLKLTDMQAAVGVAQLRKLPHFIDTRKRNWRRLYDGLKSLSEFLILPEATNDADPSWFGFAITVRPGAPFTRRDIVRHLESNKIATRMLFAGNLTRQPAYQEAHYRVIGTLPNTDLVMNNTFWVGVYPGLTDIMIDYVVDTMSSYITARIDSRMGVFA